MKFTLLALIACAAASAAQYNADYYPAYGEYLPSYGYAAGYRSTDVEKVAEDQSAKKLPYEYKPYSTYRKRRSADDYYTEDQYYSPYSYSSYPKYPSYSSYPSYPSYSSYSSYPSYPSYPSYGYDYHY